MRLAWVKSFNLSAATMTKGIGQSRRGDPKSHNSEF